MAPSPPRLLLALSSNPNNANNDRRRLLLLLSLTGAVAAAAAAAGAIVYQRRQIVKRNRARQGLEISIIGDSFTDVIVSGVGSLPGWGEDSLAARPITLAAGGSALNTALQLGHLLRLFAGAPTTPEAAVIVLHTALGDDDFGRFLRDQVLRSSPAVRLSVASTARPTATATASANTNGVGDGSSDKTGVCICLSGKHDRAFITHRGVVAAFAAAQLDRPLLRRSRIVHVAGFFNCPGLWADLPALLAECRRGGWHGGAFTALSPQHDASGAWAGLDAVFPHLDLLIPNEAEALTISGQPDVSGAARFFVDKVGGWGGCLVGVYVKRVLN